MIPANNDPTMLLAVATGRMPQPRITNTPKMTAMRNAVGTTSPTSSPVAPPVAGMGPSTPTTLSEFRDVTGLSFPLDSLQGLSSKGKYGGFTTQDQLNQAVFGEAVGQRAGALGYAADVRDFASRRMADINKALTEAETKYQPTTRLPADIPATRTDAFMDEGVGKLTPMGEKYTAQELSDYRTAMQDYARRAAMMPTQQLEMAQDISQTPLYQYARAIATNKYGMNPYQAIGEFGPELDLRAYEDTRDVMSIMQEGVPYEIAQEQEREALAQTERDYQYGQRAQAALKDDIVAYIESATGVSQNRLRQLTGMSNDMMFNAIIDDEQLPGTTPEQKVSNFRSLVANTIDTFIKGTEEEKVQVLNGINQLMANPDRPGVGQLLLASLRQYMTQQGGGQKAIGTALLDMLTPVIDINDYSQLGQ